MLLSGTPMQNDLQEFYAMVNFTNPGTKLTLLVEVTLGHAIQLLFGLFIWLNMMAGVLGDPRVFHKRYEGPILIGREPDATDQESELGLQRSTELSAIVNQFILRRTNVLLQKHLPPKVVQVVCCKMTPLQEELYRHFCQSKAVKTMLGELGLSF